MLTLAALVDRAATARRPVEAGQRPAGRRHRHHRQQGHQHRSHRHLPSSPAVCPRVPKCAPPLVERQPFRRSDLGCRTVPPLSAPSKTPSQGGGTGSNPVRAAKKRPGQRPSSEGLFPFLATTACAPCADRVRVWAERFAQVAPPALRTSPGTGRPFDSAANSSLRPAALLTGVRLQHGPRLRLGAVARPAYSKALASMCF